MGEEREKEGDRFFVPRWTDVQRDRGKTRIEGESRKNGISHHELRIKSNIGKCCSRRGNSIAILSRDECANTLHYN